MIGDNMREFFLEQVYNFVDDFYALLRLDKYISKKETDLFFDKYSDITKLVKKYERKNDDKFKKFYLIINHGYEMIKIKNEEYITQHLKIEKEYFDNMFKSVDPKIVLDEEQRRAILIDEDYSLIVAGAGSGKTTTMAAKVKYLIEKKKINPNNIILLSFTNMSVNDLNNLLNNKFNLNVSVLTFHKLGMKFLRTELGVYYTIIGDGGMVSILKNYFLDVVFKNKKILQEYMNCFSKYLNLEDECLNYDDYDKYYNWYMDKKYNECKDNLKDEIDRRIKNRNYHYITINGERVKSNGELQIANYLYKHCINYKYEEPYPYKTPGNSKYKPDFTVYNDEMPIYVEYYGPTILKNDGTYVSSTNDYQKQIPIKQKTHFQNHTDLIELYGRYENKSSYLPELSKALRERNVNKRIRTDKEIFYQLLETGKSYQYIKLINLFMVSIKVFKEKGYSTKDFDKLIQACTDELIKKQLYYFKDVYDFYEESKRNEHKIDFQDMIHDAYDNLEIIKENRKNLKYDYVIIDEYQDISFQRYSFTKRISDLFGSKIVAVGDDWQTIYSFSGSDIDLFTRFDEIMGYSEEVQITNTYRNSQELIDLAGDFILQNSYQIEKQLHSSKHLDKPVKLVKYDYNNHENKLPEKLVELLIKIYHNHPNDNILLLVRYNSELDFLLESKLFYKNRFDDAKIICKAIPNARIDLLTIHKSKGLGYDRVILLNGINGLYGLPSQICDEPIIKYLKGNYNDNEVREIIEYPEERRLFYVALTRTKNELYIMIPGLYEYRSDFIKEIECSDNVDIISENINYNL